MKVKQMTLTHGLPGALGEIAVERVDGKPECTTEVVNVRSQIAMNVLAQIARQNNALQLNSAQLKVRGTLLILLYIPEILAV